MRRHRNVKIVATLGPASDDYETIKALHLAGADVFRLNMSHGSHDDIAKRHNTIRKIEEELNSPIAVLVDLQGPKLRGGEFKNDSESFHLGSYLTNIFKNTFLFKRFSVFILANLLIFTSIDPFFPTTILK